VKAPSDEFPVLQQSFSQMGTSSSKPVVCDVAALVRPDAGTVDALARLQLALRRLGLELSLQNVSEELRGLLALMGLSEVLGVETRGQVEQREERVGLEEERQLEDPAL
jgi:ABC-type transporter Mla MlaB component